VYVLKIRDSRYITSRRRVSEISIHNRLNVPAHAIVT
jgi:hypothetical protein